LPIFKREYSIDIEKAREEFSFAPNIEKMKYYGEGRKLIHALGMRQFGFDIKREEPALYVRLKAPFVLQPDCILVEAENEIEANELFYNIIKKLGIKEEKDILKELLGEEGQEDEHLEFKTTLRYDMEKGIEDVFLEKEAVKTICAFLNTDGGILLIGVSDDKEIVGLSYDLQTFKEKQNTDAFELHLVNLIWDKIGKSFLNFIHISFPNINDKTICQIKVDVSDEPAFYKEQKGIDKVQTFYIRAKNSTKFLQMEDATKYIRKKWKK
jgi:hypothetical protein